MIKYNFEDFCTVYGWNPESNNARVAYCEYLKN